MHPKNAEGIANSVDPDYTAPLIWVCTVCPDLSVRKLRNITVVVLIMLVRKRQNPDMLDPEEICSRTPENTQKQELSMTRYTGQERTNETIELHDGGVDQSDRSVRPLAPAAPPGEAIVRVADPQQIVSPTYEESHYDPVAPANYWQTFFIEPRHEKTCVCHIRTTKGQISLRIHAVWSAPLLFTA